ncbi:hypothetical protein [Frankia sp. AgPm24]|uniref:hypothetical protein n=1 Tax=Frankia sp. AgPm24 TaxID=631128 RepID=UPI0035B37FF8
MERARGLVSEATIISRAHGIIAGLQLVDLVMHHIDPSVSIKPYLAGGDTAKPGDIPVQLHGPARSLITGERAVTEPFPCAQQTGGDAV